MSYKRLELKRQDFHVSTTDGSYESRSIVSDFGNLGTLVYYHDIHLTVVAEAYIVRACLKLGFVNFPRRSSISFLNLST